MPNRRNPIVQLWPIDSKVKLPVEESRDQEWKRLLKIAELFFRRCTETKSFVIPLVVSCTRELDTLHLPGSSYSSYSSASRSARIDWCAPDEREKLSSIDLSYLKLLIENGSCRKEDSQALIQLKANTDRNSRASAENIIVRAYVRRSRNHC